MANRSHPPDPSTLSIKFAGTVFPVNHDVHVDNCLPKPDFYTIPTRGNLGKDVQHAAVALKNKRSLYIWGMPGSGKDALIHAWSYLTRTPSMIRQVKPGTDIESWFFSRGFNESGTTWEEGEVLKALRDGYTTSSGRKIPYLILVTDFDRASRDQAEHLRLITDSIQGRVDGPAGHVYKVMNGTIVVATANTSGGGDERGRMVSSNPLDASLLDRFERKLQFHWMEWDDEFPIIRAKFPLLFKSIPNLNTRMGQVTKNLRESILNGTLHGEFSHRGLCSILSHATDVMNESDGVPPNLIGEASRVWLDGLPDESNRMIARRIMSAHFNVINQDSGQNG